MKRKPGLTSVIKKLREKQSKDADPPKKPRGCSCQICGKKLRSRYQLKIHLAVHTGEKSYICGICKKGYQQKWNLITHVARVHSKVKPFKCKDCGKAFGYSSHFKRHVKTHFLEKIDASDAVKRMILNPYKCARCDKCFESNYRLDMHMMIHMKSPPFICDKCGKSFSTKRLGDVHMKKMHGGDTRVCEHCGETFTDNYLMAWHLKTDHNVGNTSGLEKKNSGAIKKQLIPCEICGKSITRTSMNKHLNIHYRNRVYSCRYCKKEFLESGQRMVHERKHTGEKPYICDICGKGHTQYGNLLTHRRKYHNLVGTTPQLWKRNRITTSVIQKSVIPVQKIPEEEKKTEDSPPKNQTESPKSQCTGNETMQEFLKKASSWVNEKFKESKHQKTPEGDKEGGEIVEQDSPDPPDSTPEDVKEKTHDPMDVKKKINSIILKKIVDDLLRSAEKKRVKRALEKSGGNLRTFLKKMKNVPDNVIMRTRDGTLYWFCWVCNSKLKNRHLLARHLIIHEPEENRPYRCEICNKTFTQSNNYKEHKMSHLNENQYYCAICGSGFRHKTHFNTHLKRHDPKTANSLPKKFKCNYCDKKMHTNYQKKEHERTHTKERPFLCKECGRQFGTSSTLHRHQFIHSSPTHQCEICLKLFKQKSGLRRHFETHSDRTDKRVTCECGKSFSQKHSLKKHKLICKNREQPVVKPFGCCVCSKTFLTKSDLKRHVATHDSAKRFTCPVCQGCLKTEETFRKHMRRHDDVRSEKPKDVTVTS